VVLAVGLGSGGDELAAEILVRILRTQQVDGRHMALEDLQEPIPDEVNPEIVAVVFLMSVIPTENDMFEGLIQQFRERLPHAQIMAAVLGSPFELRDAPPTVIESADHTFYTYEEMVEACHDVPRAPGLISRQGR
jgi:hypothetical protein